jgi:hypothetical protein
MGYLHMRRLPQSRWGYFRTWKMPYRVDLGRQNRFEPRYETCQALWQLWPLYNTKVKMYHALQLFTYKIFETPLSSKYIRQEVFICDGGNSVVRMVRRHNGQRSCIDNGSFKWWEIRG